MRRSQRGYVGNPELQVRGRPVGKLTVRVPLIPRNRVQPFDEEHLNANVASPGWWHKNDFSIMKFVVASLRRTGQFEEVLPGRQDSADSRHFKP
jgi:hypothetical protein